MANSPITVDRLQALEIALNLTAKISLDHYFIRRDRLDDVIQLLRREALCPNIGINVCLLEDFLREARTDPVNVWKGSFDSFIAGDFYAEKTGHIVGFLKLNGHYAEESALTLLVAGVLADHANDALAFDHAAVLTEALH